MTSKSPPQTPLAACDALDRLFLDCAELETRVASILQAIDRLSPAAESGTVTVERLMNLACRVEAAERGLIAISHQIDDAANAVIRRRARQPSLIASLGLDRGRFPASERCSSATFLARRPPPLIS
jgi:hypothetical protein